MRVRRLARSRSGIARRYIEKTVSNASTRKDCVRQRRTLWEVRGIPGAVAELDCRRERASERLNGRGKIRRRIPAGARRVALIVVIDVDSLRLDRVRAFRGSRR